MKRLLLVLLSLVSLNVYANGCPGRYFPETGICQFQGNNGEVINYNVAPPQGSNQSGGISPRIIKKVTVNVPSKYGALALDEKRSILEGALNMSTEQEARRTAIQRCQQSGGRACKIIVSVRNGCIAAAFGKSKSGAGGKVSKAAAKPGQAEQIALNRCKNSGLTECRIVVPEGCSIPD